MEALLEWVFGLFALALVALWLVCFPDTRAVVAQRFARTLARTGSRLAMRAQQARGALEEGAGITRRHAWSLSDTVRRHRAAILVTAAILVVPALLILGLRRHVMLDGYDATMQINADTTSLVANLLRGEQLVPPPALPPDIFVTREVEAVRPDLQFASRNWNKFDPEFEQRLLAVFKIMKERYGYDMAMIEGYRSPERQAELATKGSSVTNAGAYQSYHQYGLAADCAFYRDGKLVISEKDPWAMRGYQLYGEVAAAAGLVWGGNWKMRDLGHVELHEPGKGPDYHRQATVVHEDRQGDPT